MTDDCDETGRLSDADAICYGPNKYGFLQLRTGTKASLLAKVAAINEMFPSPVMKWNNRTCCKCSHLPQKKILKVLESCSVTLEVETCS